MNNSAKYLMAKALGGCSSNGDMVYTRGNKRNYRQWTRLGLEGWSFKDVLPFFKKTENFIPFPITDRQTNETVSRKYHSQGGHLTVNIFVSSPTNIEIRHAFINAGPNIGAKYNNDVNGHSQLGFTNMESTIDENDLRMSTARAFLTKIPENMKICKHAVVEKIIIRNKTAIGVQFRHSKRVIQIFSAKEVILSAGSFGSPAILERSGIGDRAKVKKAGVASVHHLAGVGENLQDHYVGMINGFTVDASPGPERTEGATLTSLNAFLNAANDSSGVPTTQLVFRINGMGATAAKELPHVDLKPAILLNIGAYSVWKRSNVITISPVMLSQESRGNVHIKSKNPSELPKIVTNALSTAKDVNLMIKSFKLVQKLVKSKELGKFRIKYIPVWRCLAKGEVTSDAYYRCLVRTVAGPGYHPAGTCSMGHPANALAVVDSRLRLFGIKHLRVADASVMPILITGNPNAVVIMVGERAADFIKKDHNMIKY